MARQAITGAAYFVGGVELTSQTNRLSFENMVAELETTTFGDEGEKTYVGGLETVSLTGGGPINFASVSDMEREAYDNGRQLLAHTIGPSNSGSAVAARALVVKSLPTSLKLYGPVGEVASWEVNATGTSKAGYGKYLVSPSTEVTTTVDGTAVEIAAVPSGKYALATLHVLARSGTATLDAVVESDVDANFDGSESTRITFSQMSAVGSQFQSVAGPITDTFWRAVLTVGGSGSLTVALALGISRF